LDYIRLMRPKQWIKNIFLFAGAFFSKTILKPDILLKTVLAFVLFCVISSAVYVINDVVDAERDRMHPDKKNRPIAAGKISKKNAVCVGVFMMLAGLISSYFLGVGFMALAILYVVNSVLYTFILKNVVIIDVLSVAANFILRTGAGAAAAGVEMSSWLFLCTLQLSLLLVFSKRRCELIMLRDDATEHRKSLKNYTVEFIDHMISFSMATAIIFYSLYTFMERPKITMVTIIFVIYGILRYQYLIYVKKLNAPLEQIITKDIPLIIDIALWVISSAVILIFIG